MTLRKYYSIWVILDWLNKLAYSILLRIDYNVAKLAKIYMKGIVRLHVVPVSIVSDMGT